LPVVRLIDGASEPVDRPGCVLCGRPTYDPDKRSAPWARAVMIGRHVLVCPDCQRDRTDWADDLDRCADCGGTRLTVQLGEVVCRGCGRREAARAGA
jgi:hypothetical protein